MSRTTTNLGLTAVTNSETIGDFSDAMNASGGNLDIIDGKMGAVGGTSLQAQINTLSSKKATLVKTVIQPGASASFTFSAYATYLVCFCGYNPTVRGLLVGTASNSVANLYDSIGSPTGVEITNSGLTMTFKNNDQYALPVRIFALEGTITLV